MLRKKHRKVNTSNINAKGFCPPTPDAIFVPMARRKEAQKAAFNASPNCINADPAIRGNWEAHFGNKQPIVVEIGCGKGDHTVALAKRNPGQNFIGIDLKAARMITGARLADQHGLTNVAFLRANAEHLEQFFAPASVSGMWITFPDPFPKKKQSGRRLTHEHFLAIYLRILKPGAEVKFKTDNLSLFEYTLAHFEELEQKDVVRFKRFAISRNVHADAHMRELAAVTTDYERRFIDMGKPIHFLHFSMEPGANVAAIPVTEPVELDKAEKAPRQSGPSVADI
jgi:tRNA (guanine-N7-)-methyltransferase